MGYLRGIVHGAIIGGAVALLYAPKPGRQMREELSERLDQVRGQVKPVLDQAQGVVDSARPQVERGISKAQQQAQRITRRGDDSGASVPGPEARVRRQEPLCGRERHEAALSGRERVLLRRGGYLPAHAASGVQWGAPMSAITGGGASSAPRRSRPLRELRRSAAPASRACPGCGRRVRSARTLAGSWPAPA